MITKSSLAIWLSRLSVFDKPDIKAEQYPTDSEIAADAIWNAYMLGDIEDRQIFDLGAGTGILGIGTLMMGGNRCVFVEREKLSASLLRDNLKSIGFDAGRWKIIEADISEFKGSADTVIQNPPFGTKTIHADREFLDKALACAPVVYSFHKTSTDAYIVKYAQKSGYRQSHRWHYSFPLKKSHAHHKRSIHRIDVTLHRFIKRD